MRPIRNYEKTQAYTDRKTLPRGAYVLKIMDVKYISANAGMRSDCIELSFDIAEGEFAGYYAEDWKQNTNEDKRWRGVYRLYVPNDDGTEKDGWTARRFKTVIVAFEDSNPGYRWDWDESKLKGKQIGGLFNQREWSVNGRTGWATQCAQMCAVKSVKEGTFRIPDDKPIATSARPATATDGFMDVSNDGDELPFN